MRQNTLRTLLIVAALIALAVPLTATAQEGHSRDELWDSARYKQAQAIQQRMQESANNQTIVAPQVPNEAQLKQKLLEHLELKRTERQKSITNTQAEAAQKTATLRQKLDDKKLKACQTHQTNVNSIMNAMDTRRQKAFDHITKISDATQSYYLKNEVNVANYDMLVASVTVAKETAQNAIDAQQSAPPFNCSGEQPRADIADFKEKRSASIDALQAYRSAVRTLVGAVKDAALGDQTNTNKEGS